MKKITIIILAAIVFVSCFTLYLYKKYEVNEQITKEQLTEKVNLLVNVKLIQNEIETILKYRIAIRIYFVLHETNCISDFTEIDLIYYNKEYRDSVVNVIEEKHNIIIETW